MRYKKEKIRPQDDIEFREYLQNIRFPAFKAESPDARIYKLFVIMLCREVMFQYNDTEFVKYIEYVEDYIDTGIVKGIQKPRRAKQTPNNLLVTHIRSFITNLIPINYITFLVIESLIGRFNITTIKVDCFNRIKIITKNMIKPKDQNLIEVFKQLAIDNLIIRNMANEIYTKREWSCISILADLMEERLTTEQIDENVSTCLNNMRDSNQLWCRGCWILDRLIDTF